MRKLTEKRKVMTLYLPETLFNRLETYVLNHYGRTYGKNETIINALDQYLTFEEEEELFGNSKPKDTSN